MKYSSVVVISLVVLAGLLQSCKHDPVSTPPDTNKVDTTHRLLGIVPDSVHTTVLVPVVYTATLAPGPFAKPYKLDWVVDGVISERVSTDTFSVRFTTAGVHSVSVTWIDSTGKARASDTTIATAAIQHTPNDTTSHAFAWQEYTVGGESSFNSVFVFDSVHIYASGLYLWHLSGNSWIQVPIKEQSGLPVGGASLRLFGFSPNDFWWIGGGYAYHDTGSGRCIWYSLVGSGVMTSADGALRAAWGTSSKNMYFVGDKGTIIHFDGTTWTNLPKVTTKDLYSISGSSDHDIWACGYNTGTGETVLLHSDGKTWSEDPFSSHRVDETGGFLSVWAGDSAGVPIAMTSGSFIHQKTNAAVWRSCVPTVPNLLPDNSPDGMLATCAGPNDILAAGSWGYVMHWNGKSWKRWDEYLDVASNGYFPQSVSFKGNTACIVGLKDGGSWILLGRR